MTKFTKLVLSGGSVKGFSQLGAIQYFIDKQLLDIDTYVGTSCGTIVSYLLIIGYTPAEIISYICTKNAMENIVSEFDIMTMINGKGLTDFNLQQILEKMTIDKIGHLLTMKEMYEKYGKDFTCTAYNLTLKKTEYFNHKTHPTMPCIIAIRMSCNIPLVFAKYKYMNSYYIDGGASDNLPLELVDKDDNKVLGINLQTRRDKVTNDNEDFNFTQDFMEILFISIHQNTLNKINNCSSNCKVFTLKTETETKFNLSKKEILQLFSEGYQQIKDMYESN